MNTLRDAYGRFTDGPLYTSIESLDCGEYGTERVVRLPNARVVLANYRLLQHDFPALRDEVILRAQPRVGEGAPAARQLRARRRIDEWLLRHAAVISREHAAQTVVNARIDGRDEGQVGHRPPRYGRALVIPVAWEGHAGLLDVKGVGVSPKSRPHLREQLNGLSYLGEVLSDFFTQLLVDAVLAAALPSVTTVPVYAVIDAGFNARFMDGERLGPAGILVRRAHRRPVGNVERPEPGSAVERVKLTIEMLLRAYGITSAIDDGDIMLTADGDSVKVHHGGIEQKLPAAARELLRREVLGDRQQVYFEGVNVQLTRGVQLDPLTAELVDFGQYNVRERFEAPAVCLTYNNPALIGAVLEPDHPAYVQPSPKLRVPFGLWGEAKDWSSLGPPVAFQQPIGPRYRAIAYTLADRIHRGVSDRGDIDRALAELLSPVLS